MFVPEGLGKYILDNMWTYWSQSNKQFIIMLTIWMTDIQHDYQHCKIIIQ